MRRHGPSQTLELRTGFWNRTAIWAHGLQSVPNPLADEIQRKVNPGSQFEFVTRLKLTSFLQVQDASPRARSWLRTHNIESGVRLGYTGILNQSRSSSGSRSTNPRICVGLKREERGREPS